MDIEKMRKWLEITNEYKKSDFWTRVLEKKYPEKLVDDIGFHPNIDIYQNEYYNFIIVELPGVSREDLSLALISNKQLKISGKFEPILPLEKEIQKEITYGVFERVVNLPEATGTQQIHLQMNNGLLQISYPRKVEPIPFVK